MHHFVPDFGTDDEYVHMTNSSALNLPRKSIIGDEGEDDLMELLWHKGQVVVQNQRLTNTSPPKLQASVNHQPSDSQNLFIQEDEMTSWLRDDDFSSDLLSENASATPSATATVENQMITSQVTAARPPVRNFMNFSRLREDFSGRVESGPLISKPIVRESTVVIPTAPPSSTDVTESSVELNRKGKGVTTTAPETEILGTSSSAVSKSEIETEKTREATECRSKETKHVRGSKKRSRAAEVHNLSERKRRDRINERMKTLQELIPRCNKTDKASMLEEAIEYMKSLQLQVKMMSMGCGMMPMMYPGMQQQYMAMGMGINQPPSFMPFPNMPLSTQTHLGGSGQPYPDQSRVFLPNQQYDLTLNQTQHPGYMDPYKQFHILHQTQLPQFQKEATSYPSSSRVSSSKESEDQGNHTTS